MAKVKHGGEKLFDLNQSIGDDDCALQSRDLFNESGFDYRVQNFYGKERDRLIDFATEQTNLRFQEGYGTPTSAVIDESSKIRHDFGWSARGRTSLATRIYQAVPNLSHGVPNPDVESDMFHVKHDMVSRVVMESDLSRFIPLIEPIKEKVQNPDNIVPSAWVHGGADTRGQLREPEYLLQNGFRQDPATGVWTRAA